ncbi:RNA-binding domain-containing protein [Biscogniauxia sp. FL1348]|nr:RNA-binding domain-containing protein [Biscogniauxia sp. FL1348]
MSKTENLKRPRGQPDDATILSAEPTVAGAGAGKRPSKKPRIEESRTLFVRSLPPTATTETLSNHFNQHFPIKHATVVLDRETKTSRGYGFVTFTDAEDANEALKKLQHGKLDGRPLLLELAEARHRQSTGTEATGAAARKEERQAALAEARKAPKLIIRNLPWSIKHSDQLAALFQSFGKVKYADIPQSKGKLSGFGFVTMRGRPNAEKAMEAINGKTVDGRTLAVDWAVDKQTWEQKNQQKEPATKPKLKSNEAPEDANKEGGEEEEEEESSEKDDDKDEDDDDDDEDEDVKNFIKNHMQNLEDEDSDADDVEDDDEDEDASDDDATSGGAPVSPKKTLSTNNNSTLFIRNLPFTTTDADLKSHFEQFGHVRYARIVMDRATDRPAGTGFVCFFSENDSKECLRGAPRPQQMGDLKKKSILQNELADEEGKYTIEGRILQVSQAVNKDEATRLAEMGVAQRQGKDKDKRRLYLLSEGVIPKDSPLHAMLAPSEVKIRDQSAAQRKKLIQTNPSLHLSLTRLAIRNIPRNIDSKKLKALAREAVVGFATDVKEGRRQALSKEENARGGEEDKEAERRRKEKGKGIVKQSKIVFENREGSKVPEADGAGKSRGYGFIEYSSHRWALMGLRWLNGHALKDEAGKTHRLIVEFAIENAQVVARRQELQAKSRAYAASRPTGQKPAEVDESKSNFRGKGRRDLPKGKDFSVSKDRRPGPPKGQGKGKGEDPGKGGDASREALNQKIIGRKRMMRKKKAQARG